MKRAILLLPLLLVGSCEQLMPHYENARAVLQHFCALHKQDIFQLLLTPDQIEAGAKLCHLVGYNLGE